jgi:hypothetical protein
VFGEEKRARCKCDEQKDHVPMQNFSVFFSVCMQSNARHLRYIDGRLYVRAAAKYDIMIEMAKNSAHLTGARRRKEAFYEETSR